MIITKKSIILKIIEDHKKNSRDKKEIIQTVIYKKDDCELRKKLLSFLSIFF